MREEERERATSIRSRVRRSAEDTDRIDRILELSRSRSREMDFDERMRNTRDDTRRRVEEYRREVDLTERARVTARRSFERATSVLNSSAPTPSQILNQPLRRNVFSYGADDRNHDQDLANEFVRDSPDPEAQPAAKRPRMAGDQESETQYDADIAEALSRSLADQGGARSEASGDQPQPGCSHWTAPSAASAQVCIYINN